MEGAAVNIESDNEVLENLRISMLAKRRPDPPIPASYSIFSISRLVGSEKRGKYEPAIISIGPFHRGGSPRYQLMENVKWWYLDCLLSSTDTKLESLIEDIIQLYEKARNCYADHIRLEKKDFIEMLILDGCFLIEVSLRMHSQDLKKDDPIFNMGYIMPNLYHDLMLLDNQLPWFVLDHIYTFINKSANQFSVSTDPTDATSIDLLDATLTGLVLHIFTPFVESSLRIVAKDPKNIMHLLDLIRTWLFDPFKDLGSGNQHQNVAPDRIPNATTLADAGVRFKKSENRADPINHIHFKNGEFTIPTITLDHKTVPLFSNLIAFEECFHSCPNTATSYAFLMDSLIDSSKDNIDFLVKKGIIRNSLSDEDACRVFHDICTDVAIIGFDYRNLIDKVNSYYKKRDKRLWRWIKSLRHDYFSSPWTVISLIAAFILMALTLLQTIYTMKQYYEGSS